MSSRRDPFTLLPIDSERLRRIETNPYLNARDKISRILVKYTLIDSYHKFRKARLPYPFVQPALLRPGSVAATREYVLHNNALVILVDGMLPDKLRKHFHYREGNRVRKKTIAEVAPDIQGMENYSRNHRRVTNPGFEGLMRMLLPLDYALLVQNSQEEGRLSRNFRLTNFHVKIERLTDNALRGLGTHLNYLTRSLYERGDAFVESLEKKFYEYHSFYHNAAGRRSASALATQLLNREGLQGTIYIASQQDRRLTLLSTSGESRETHIEQYLLLLLPPERLAQLKKWGRKRDLDIRRNYLVAKHGQDGGVVLFRIRYEHTAAGRPSPNGALKSHFDPKEKWIRIKDEAILPLNPKKDGEIAYQVAFQNTKSNQ
ncbi:MAG: hypothetical protein HQL52_11345 [Magnetococcales bacterium]|nr:hypothetical protein [Magnetococcales bacterium]